jgi:hypothetical protein
VKSQGHQADEANGKSVAEDTNASSGKGLGHRRERFAGWLGDSPAVQIISFVSQAAAVASIIVAAITYYTERDERTQEKYYQAW